MCPRQHVSEKEGERAWICTQSRRLDPPEVVHCPGDRLRVESATVTQTRSQSCCNFSSTPCNNEKTKKKMIHLFGCYDNMLPCRECWLRKALLLWLLWAEDTLNQRFSNCSLQTTTAPRTAFRWSAERLQNN